MNIKPDCIPCVARQALDVARLVTDDEVEQTELVLKVLKEVAEIPSNVSAPIAGRLVHGTLARLTGVPDPYRSVKDTHIKNALSLYPELKEFVARADDPVYAALCVSALGNIIDAAFTAGINVDSSLLDVSGHNMGRSDYDEFRRLLVSAKSLLIIGDNAGETVFDRVLIETLGLETIYSVRERAIINDATLGDARQSGLEEVARVISSGCSAPGALLDQCSEEFVQALLAADIVISKGQGNFEALENQTPRPVFFLLKAKCEPIAKELGVSVGDLVFARIP